MLAKKKKKYPNNKILPQLLLEFRSQPAVKNGKFALCKNILLHYKEKKKKGREKEREIIITNKNKRNRSELK